MKNPINKSNIRRPLRGVLLLAILLIASNLFISSISQFFIANREIDNISRYFRSSGYLDPIDYNDYNVKEAQQLITDDPMIKSENGIRYTIGMVDELYKYKSDSRMAGQTSGENVFDLIFIGEIKEAYKSRSANSIYEGSLLATGVIDILAGIPDFIESDTFYKNSQEHHIGFLSHSIEDGEEFEYINDDVIDEIFEMEEGKKYLFRSFKMLNKSGSIVKPLYEGGPLYLELDDDGKIDWNNPEFNIIKDEIDFINQNIISYKLVGTEDMTGMPEVQDGSKDYYLTDGRWIDREDNESANHVVVIHRGLAEMYGLEVGDKVKIQMRDSENGTALFSEKDKKEWRTYYTSEGADFEIVGLYESNIYPGTHETIYISESTIPKELGRYTKGLDEPIPYVYSHLYNFVLESPEDEPAFIEKYREQLRDLGFDLKFVANNVNGFLKASASIKRSSTISFIVFSVLLILMQGFVVYIYIDGHKSNYAIERALGVPADISGKHVIKPLIISGSIASLIGGIAGYQRAEKNSMEILESIPSSIERITNSQLDVRYFILFIILSIIPFIVMLLFRMKRLKNESVIDLINQSRNKKKPQSKNEKLETAKASTSKIIEGDVEAEETEDNEKKNYMRENERVVTKNNKKALRRFSLIHILRSKGTSLLLIALAGIFIVTLLWMNHLTIKNKDIMEKTYKGYVITADIILKENAITKAGTGPISGSHIDNLMETGLIQGYKATALMIYDELYINRNGRKEQYEVGEKDKVHFYTYDPTFRVETSNKPYNLEEGIFELIDLNLQEGYSLEDFYEKYTVNYSDQKNPKIVNEKGEEGFPILASNDAMEHFDLQLEDKILLKSNSNHLRLVVEEYGTIVGTFNRIDKGSDYYGYSLEEKEEIFIYPISALEAIEHKLFYNTLEFIFRPEHNKKLMDQKEELRKKVSSNPLNEIGMDLSFWDGELTNVVEPLEKNLSLLEVLYPLTFILSIVIAGILAFMMSLRRGVDVSILRVLGVKSKEVRWSLFRENLILVIIGIVLSSIIIISITSASYPIELATYLKVIGGYLLGTVVGLVLGIGRVTNKKPLEMLQVKE